MSELFEELSKKKTQCSKPSCSDWVLNTVKQGCWVHLSLPNTPENRMLIRELLGLY